MATEIETKLAFALGQQARVREQFLAMTHLGNYRLDEPVTNAIEDVYFDTPALALLGQDAGLRIRRVNGKESFTLKIGGGVDEDGTHTREEIEGPALPEMLAYLWDALDTRGLVHQTSAGRKGGATTLAEVLMGWGLQPQYTALNERLTRVVRSDSGQPLAALVLDDVTLQVNGAPAGVLCELEIEAIAGNADLLPSLVASLRDQFPMALRPETQSKYQQAMALLGRV